MAERETVLEISIRVRDGKGNERVINVDPSVANAVFWADESVMEILGGFYDRGNYTITRLECESVFGTERTQAAMGSTTQARITKSFIQTLWNTPDNQGKQIAIMAKDHRCIPG